MTLEFTPALLSFPPLGNSISSELMTLDGEVKSHPNGLENVPRKYIFATSPHLSHADGKAMSFPRQPFRPLSSSCLCDGPQQGRRGWGLLRDKAGILHQCILLFNHGGLSLCVSISKALGLFVSDSTNAK